MNSTKPSVFAVLLPQFYETSYNNEWWGKGFTDFVAARNGKTLFPGHRQPKLPRFGEYDQSKPETLARQAELAQKYHVDGFAIYHYYSLGSHLLEKPMEVLLAHPEIDMPFFIYWANEDWRKNWFGHGKQMIWHQEYGKERDWHEHFEYCLPFFRDNRYVKFDNMPVFIIYRPLDLIVFHEMAQCWNSLARANGFDGIYFVATSPNFDHIVKEENGSGQIDDPQYMAIYYRNPTISSDFSTNLLSGIRHVIDETVLAKADFKIPTSMESYDHAWKRSLQESVNRRKDVILGAFPSFDNSARKGWNSQVMIHDTPEKFGRYLSIQLQRAMRHGGKAVLINAWNEWGEGNYLEPDTVNGYAYLEEIKEAVEKLG